MAQRQLKRVAVVMPVGPKDAEGAIDTIASALYYLDQSRIIVVIDDTDSQVFCNRAQGLSPDIVILPAAPLPHGMLGGLWVKQAAGYQWLLERFEPELVLRLDADALIIGAGIEELAIQEFARNPQVGLLGSYRVRSDGALRDWSWAARRLRTEMGLRGFRHPPCRRRLRELVALARQNAYVDGEHALGACAIHSFSAVDAIYARGWFQEPYLATSRLGDDHLIGLLTMAAGYRIADFNRPEDPIAMMWRGLPAHPNELLANKKLITHSVRSWEGLKEPEIRSIFASSRDSEYPAKAF